jgi:hypothetical protein
MIDLQREICKPVLSLDFMAYGINGVPLRGCTIHGIKKVIWNGHGYRQSH